MCIGIAIVPYARQSATVHSSVHRNPRPHGDLEMDAKQLTDPSFVDSLLTAIDHHSFAALVILVLAGFAVYCRKAGKE